MKRISSASSCGALLIALGLIVMMGWLIRAHILTSILPGYINMVFNTALNFILSGLALIFITQKTKFYNKTLPLLLGAIITIITLLTLSQTFLGYSTGIDELFIKASVVDINPYPGRMALNTSICFLLASIVIMALPFGKTNKLFAFFIQIFTFIIFLLAFSALLGYLLDVQNLYGWYRYSQMAIPTAVGMLLLSAGLTRVWSQLGYSGYFYKGHEDKRIIITSIMIFFIAVYTAALSGFALVTKDTELLLKNSLTQSLNNRIVIFLNTINRTLQNTDALSDILQHALQSNTDQLTILKNTLSLQTIRFSSIKISDGPDHVIYQKGDFINSPKLAIPINSPHNALVLWDDGWYIQFTRKIMHYNSAQVDIKIQWPLPDIDLIFMHFKGLGQTNEMVICAARNPKLAQCFPSRLSPQPFTVKDHSQPNTSSRPIFDALSGKHGVKYNMDYRNKSIIAAYSPLGQLGLGIVNKIDTIELYQRVRTQLNHILLIGLFTIIGCIIFIHLLIRPLLKKVISSEREMRLQKDLLEASESRLHAIMDNSAEGIITINEAGEITSLNKKIEIIFEYSIEEIMGKSIKKLMPAHLHKAHDEGMERYLETGIAHIVGKSMVEVTGLRKNGDVFPLELSIAEIWHNEQRIFTGILRDITQRKKIEASLLESEQRFYNAFAYAAIGMALVKLDGGWLKVNHALCAITGYTETELLQTNFQAITYPDDIETDLSYIEQLLTNAITSYQMEKRYYHKKGHIIWVSLSVSLLKDALDKPLYFISQIQDITIQKQTEQQLLYQAQHDSLTGLANRACLMFGLENAIAAAKRNKKMIAVLFMDLDKFKPINDQFGHIVGDALLQHVAVCLKQCTRSTDIVARVGGDEFVIVLTDIITEDNVTNVANKIITSLIKTVTIKDHELSITTSIGISLYPKDAEDILALLNQADQALYQAKSSGRNKYQFHRAM